MRMRSLGPRHSFRFADYGVLCVWVAAMITVAAARPAFSGEGFRHILTAFSAEQVPFGDSRWLLFPTLVYGLVEFFKNLGWSPHQAQAAHAFLAVNIAAGLLYLILLRKSLSVLDIGKEQASGALALAAVMWPLVNLSSNLFEPLVPAVIALFGIVWAARRRSTRTLICAVALIGLASLLYQAIALSVFLLACVVPPRTLRRREIVLSGTVLLIFTVAIPGAALYLQGDSQILDRLLLSGGEKDVFFRRMYNDPSLGAYIKAAFAGPPRTIIQLPLNFGLHGLAAKALTGRLESSEFLIFALSASCFAFSWAILICAVRAAFKNRHWVWVLAFFSVFLLPVLLRNQQYAYLKYYSLFPFILALGICRLKASFIWTTAALIAVINVLSITCSLRNDHKVTEETRLVYSRFPEDACYIATSHWGAFLESEWRGRLYNPLIDLVDPAIAEDDEKTRNLKRRLESCFCESSVVVTDGFTSSNASEINHFLNNFRYPGPPIDAWLWNEQRGDIIVSSEGFSLYRYSEKSRTDICSRLRKVNGLGDR